MEKHEEIERKFLVTENAMRSAGVSQMLPQMPYMDIVQGYLPAIGGMVVRLRQVLYVQPGRNMFGEAYYWTIKGSSEPRRMERETPVWKQQFQEMWPLFEPLQLHKHRYQIPAGDGKTVHLDFYKNGESGLITAEVEFDSIDLCEAYSPEPWFGNELTGVPGWSNYDLAVARMKRVKKETD
jgi:CYTH domain-containing protein